MHAELEAKIREAQKDVSELKEVQKGVMRNRSWMDKQYNKMYITESLETAKQRLTVLVTRLNGYTREEEAKRVNSLFSKDPPRVCSQLQGNNSTRAGPPRAETEQYWKNI